jgi:hypothetical protein
MIDIIVKRPSLSPTLKWLRVSLAPTGVYNEILIDSNKSINLSNLANGVYILESKSINGHIKISKIVKL